MPQETELKLSLQPQDIRRLLSHPLLRQRVAERQRLLNTYFDTAQLSLADQRIAVRERRIGRRTWLTVKTAGITQGGLSRRGEWEGPTRAGALDFAALVDDADLAQTLCGLARELKPIFRTDFIRKTWQLTYAGAHIEVALDRGHITAGHMPGAPAGVLQERLLELELELKAGPEDALLDLAHTLALGPRGEASHGIWLYPDARSKAERGLALFLDQRAAPVKAASVHLTALQHPVNAFRTVALGCLTHWQVNIAPWLDAGETRPADHGFVHQARVALRRLRTGLCLFSPFLPPHFVSHWGAPWKATAALLSALRNWDALCTDTLPRLLGPEANHPEWQPLLNWVAAQRHAARHAVRVALHQPSHALDVLAFTRAVMALPTKPAAGRGPRLDRWARKTLRRQHAALMRQTHAALHAGPKGHHALRLRVKQLRYALDFLGNLLTPEALARSRAPLARAQHTLGRLNDLFTAHTLLAACPLAERNRLMVRVDAALDQRMRRLAHTQRALLRSPAPG